MFGRENFAEDDTDASAQADTRALVLGSAGVLGFSSDVLSTEAHAESRSHRAHRHRAERARKEERKKRRVAKRQSIQHSIDYHEGERDESVRPYTQMSHYPRLLLKQFAASFFITMVGAEIISNFGSTPEILDFLREWGAAFEVKPTFSTVLVGVGLQWIWDLGIYPGWHHTWKKIHESRLHNN